LTAAIAGILEHHQTALDVSDENARKEYEAYVKLEMEFGSVASQLQATAEHMAGYRDLPMGRHDERAMASPKALDAFATFVKVEQELLELLQKEVERDRKMLAEMQG